MNNHRINAVSISSALVKVLSGKNYRGTVAGVYTRSGNFSFGDFLVTVSDVSQKNLPYGILCDLSEIDLQGILRSDDAAEIDSERLVVRERDFEISLRSASIWDPGFYLPIKASDVPIIQQNIHQLIQHIVHLNNPDGLVPLFRFIPNLMKPEAYPGDSPSQLSLTAYGALRSIITAIRNTNERSLNEGCMQLVGLGIGLTPSGDDILAGLFATLIITSKVEYRNWLMEILEKLLPRIEGLTNEISINYLKAISQGYFPERVSSLISAMITAKSFADVQPALQEMLEWGHTSGYEITLGMVIGLLLSVENLDKPFKS